MKKFVAAAFLGFVFLTPNFSAHAGYVSGYTRSNGTHVQGYYRTSADGNPYNNYSYPGNYNPNTGKVTGGSASTYLNNYYKTNSYSSPSYTPSFTSSYSYPTTPSCPLNSYSNGSSCTCMYGYVSNGSSCVSGNNLCYAQTGLMSSYDSLSNTCKCMSGYAIGTSGRCEYQSIYNSYSNGYSGESSSLGNSCPTHSSQSLVSSNKCTCDVGYQTNSNKDSCVLIPQTSNDQQCQDSFGSKSKWSGELNSSGTPTCKCKDKYQWNPKQTRCVKS